jgi:LAGLIDADG DNA endonuclease family
MTTLNIAQKDLILGTLLGDGNLQTSSNGKTWRYRALHNSDHEAYIIHKWSILSSLCNKPPIFAEVWDERTQKVYKRLYFNTRVDKCFDGYASLFYTFNNQKKCWEKDVPINLSQYVTPRAIAYWYMDDGSLKWKGHSNAMRICTESFSPQGVDRLRNVLLDKFDIPTTRTKETKKDGSIGWRISIPEKYSSKFRYLIEPYLVDCMKYKVSDGNYGTL